ncbi:hypothetical protein SK128_010419 [Halocaridina rubra]|uniref:Uncharacterized protein n=1 Tax=Halocaridina rubra TaxID=373956 RepID=A0AAN8WHT6_HALRR
MGNMTSLNGKYGCYEKEKSEKDGKSPIKNDILNVERQQLLNRSDMTCKKRGSYGTLQHAPRFVFRRKSYTFCGKYRLSYRNRTLFALRFVYLTKPYTFCGDTSLPYIGHSPKRDEERSDTGLGKGILPSIRECHDTSILTPHES